MLAKGRDYKSSNRKVYQPLYRIPKTYIPMRYTSVCSHCGRKVSKLVVNSFNEVVCTSCK